MVVMAVMTRPMWERSMERVKKVKKPELSSAWVVSFGV